MNRKIYAIAAAFTMAFTMVSCEEDDEPEYVAPDVFSGRWVLDEVGAINSAGAINYVDAQDECADDEINFAGNAFSSSDSSLNIEGNCATVTREGSWELVDGNLEFTAGAEEFRRDVLTLNQDMMVLVYTNSDGNLQFLKYRKDTEE